MTAVDLVVIVLIAIGAAIIAVLTTIGVSALTQAHRARLEPLIRVARQAVVAALSGEESKEDDALACLRRLPTRYMVNVMLDLAPSVSGASRSVLVSLGDKTGILPRARDGLSRRRWCTRLYSARVLSVFGVQSEKLNTLFNDRSSEVRAQAAAWSVVEPNAATIELLVYLLNDADGLCRFAAQDALIRIGLPASEALIRALKCADGNLTERILEVAAFTADDRFYEQASVRTSDGTPEIRSLAAAVLARTGNPSAGPTLVSLLSDSCDEVVLAAAAGLQALSYWPCAAAVESLLSHLSWEVRKQAGLTLLALGAPGSILLRANMGGDGPAAEMAIQVLQLQALGIQDEAA
jgi:hypothetical protein